MKVQLLRPDSNHRHEHIITKEEEIVLQDLELNAVIEAMSLDDRYLKENIKKYLLSTETDVDILKYRQDCIKDCINNPIAIRNLYAYAEETIKKKSNHYWGFTSTSLSTVLYASVNMLKMLAEMLYKLRLIADEHNNGFKSQGFHDFFSMLQDELSDEYLEEMKVQLKELEFSNGILISSELGNNNQGINYVLRRQKKGLLNSIKWQFTPSFIINERDEAGWRDFNLRTEIATNKVTNALYQSSEHVLTFFENLRLELAFYIGCLNLYERLERINAPICYPDPKLPNKFTLTCDGLYDIALALTTQKMVVGNQISGVDKSLFIVTGANQGGKSTFLRSIGQAQIMMQCGMFVSANGFSANLCQGVYTHFKKEEDKTMKHGRLDEELFRLSETLKEIKPNSLILFNESFSSTNEREGSEIASQITRALLEQNHKIFFVTHFYIFASIMKELNNPNYAFFQAERLDSGKRTFRIIEGLPEKTSYGLDLFSKIFKEEA